MLKLRYHLLILTFPEFIKIKKGIIKIIGGGWHLPLPPPDAMALHIRYITNENTFQITFQTHEGSRYIHP